MRSTQPPVRFTLLSIQLTALDGYTAGTLVRDEIAARAFSSGPNRPLECNNQIWMGKSASVVDATARAGIQFRSRVIGTRRPRASSWFPARTGLVAGGWLAPGRRGGYSTGRLAIDNGSEAKNFSNPRALGYAGYRNGRWTTHAGVSAARMSVRHAKGDRFRSVHAAGRPTPLWRCEERSDKRAFGLTVETWAEQRFELDLGPWSVFPSAGLRFARYGRRSWKETGAGDLSVSGPAQALTSKEIDLGLLLVRTTRTIPAARLRDVSTRCSATVRRERPYSSRGKTEGGFAVDGLPLARGTFVGRAGMRSSNRKHQRLSQLRNAARQFPAAAPHPDLARSQLATWSAELSPCDASSHALVRKADHILNRLLQLSIDGEHGDAVNVRPDVLSELQGRVGLHDTHAAASTRWHRREPETRRHLLSRAPRRWTPARSTYPPNITR